MAHLRLPSSCLRLLATGALRRGGIISASSSSRASAPSSPSSSSPSSPSPSPTPALTVSAQCQARLLELNASAASPKMLRLEVEGGGCSGFQYKFALDDQVAEDDHVFGSDPRSSVVVDDTSLSLVRGATLDYHQELIRSAFRVVSNPQSEAGCSCGVSFSLKM